MSDVKDRVKETTTTTGSGNLTLDGAYTGFQTFNNAFGTNVSLYYCIATSSGSTEWEVGSGHLSNATTFVRDDVESSSNGGSAVNLSAGTKDVFVSIPGTFAADLICRGRVEMTRLGATLL